MRGKKYAEQMTSISSVTWSFPMCFFSASVLPLRHTDINEDIYSARNIFSTSLMIKFVKKPVYVWCTLFLHLCTDDCFKVRSLSHHLLSTKVWADFRNAFNSLVDIYTHKYSTAHLPKYVLPVDKKKDFNFLQLHTFINDIYSRRRNEIIRSE
jgi:hypothetical protein